ncbi:carbon monoxide dehydrogenase [Streptomyces sp. SA15]|uniref:SRPBCC family protein n=1 Tax=Streptomyces sp. SA15 TaxID=934019 RepID=UPI000BAF48CC|nr:SRPBCC family protein [Streptomyces sp. SA15]PAZ12336.1 carbon monoxide dehydrogenase [Streptomyces sp. SA15]
MQLTNSVLVEASPDEVFALMNDVERVASCMPGAALDGQDGDAWRGKVKIRVGPISASYAGTVRFLEVDAERRRLRAQARGADIHGSGDAEAEVSLEVLAAPEGALLQLSTDLVIRGKIVQFGKGAIVTVSDRILQQFARNLGSLLDRDRDRDRERERDRERDRDRIAGTSLPEAAPSSAPFSSAPYSSAPFSSAPFSSAPFSSATAPAAARPALAPASDLDGLAMLLGPSAAKYGLVAGAFAFGLLEGWLLGRLGAQARELRALRALRRAS